MTLEVPPKKEIVVYAPLAAKQEVFYTAVVNKTIAKMLGQEKVCKDCKQVSVGLFPISLSVESPQLHRSVHLQLFFNLVLVLCKMSLLAFIIFSQPHRFLFVTF